MLSFDLSAQGHLRPHRTRPSRLDASLPLAHPDDRLRVGDLLQPDQHRPCGVAAAGSPTAAPLLHLPDGLDAGQWQRAGAGGSRRRAPQLGDAPRQPRPGADRSDRRWGPGGIGAVSAHAGGGNGRGELGDAADGQTARTGQPAAAGAWSRLRAGEPGKPGVLREGGGDAAHQPHQPAR